MKHELLKLKNNFSIGIIFLFLASGIWSCTSVGVDGSQDPGDQMKAINAEILAMTKNKTCRQDSECRVAALGAKPCGGPKKYVIYSMINVNENDLLIKASTYNSLDRQVSGDSGSVGTCEVLLPPRLTCQKSVCAQAPLARSTRPRPQ